MFPKFRTRRANTDKNAKAGIFRSKARMSKDESPAPDIGQVLTMTLSEDSVDSCNEVHLIDNEQTNTVRFTGQTNTVLHYTEQQVMENALVQMREVSELNESNRQLTQQLAERQLQVIDMKQQLTEKQHICIELKRIHTLKMTAKQEEIHKVKNVLHEVETELKDTKQEFFKVSSILIGCQHELHEQQNKSFFGWF